MGFGRPCGVCGRSRYDHPFEKTEQAPNSCGLRLILAFPSEPAFPDGLEMESDGNPFKRTKTNPVLWRR
jgi:hypothetical protein